MKVRIVCSFDIDITRSDDLHTAVYGGAVIEKFRAAAKVVEQHVRQHGVKADNIRSVEIIQ